MTIPRAATLVAVLASLTLAAPAAAQSQWAPADQATIHPGVQTYTDGAQCTANFVFTRSSSTGTEVFIGQAAHCSGTGDSSQTNGCEAESLPDGTQVEIDGASRPGTMVYNSWNAMKANRETDSNACEYNDFALIRIDPADVSKVNPTVPYWGGPAGLTSATSEGEKVYSYGNSSLRGGVEQTSPKEGYSLGQSGGGWTHDVYTLTPGIPGDSGSGFLNRTGAAFGVLSTVALAPLPASNGVSDLVKMLAYASHNGYAVTLENGTEPFEGGPLP